MLILHDQREALRQDRQLLLLRAPLCMHLEIRHLRLVKAIAESASVTKAAERLNLTQSAVSHQLREIETRLNAPLFLRTGKRMVLASAGARVLESAETILRELAQVERDIEQEAGRGPEGVLRLTTECYTCYHWLPSVLQRFRSKYPRVEVQVVPEATPRSLNALASGEVDLAIVSPQSMNSRFRYVPLFKDELVVVASPEHPFAERKFVTAKDFAGQALVLYDVPNEDMILLRDILRPAQIEVGHITYIQLTEGIVELVKAGFGVSALARWSVAPHVDTGTLAAVKLGRLGTYRTWNAAVRGRGALPSYLDAFLTVLAATSFDGLRSERPGGRPRLSA